MIDVRSPAPLSLTTMRMTRRGLTRWWEAGTIQQVNPLGRHPQCILRPVRVVESGLPHSVKGYPPLAFHMALNGHKWPWGLI